MSGPLLELSTAMADPVAQLVAVPRVLQFRAPDRFIKFRDHNGAAKALEDLREVKIHGRTASLSKAASSSR